MPFWNRDVAQLVEGWPEAGSSIPSIAVGRGRGGTGTDGWVRSSRSFFATAKEFKAGLGRIEPRLKTKQ